ncbi:unnamed protein product [Clonostachys rosea]|uniref:Transcription factor domain-containing protein n=1 Tax=Bionectria ochroleuca TaxID=29856 RepID=A0ABY6U7I1_BIOOC|nr:unnamed protein product [Clonostachys rosea]
MSYYIKVLSELLTVSRENNSFTSAMESPALYEALLAYASGHLSSLDSSYSVVALKARSESLSHLSKALNTSSWDILHPESTVAASLILLTSEVCLGSHKGWYGHLVGAKHLILSTQSTSQSDTEPSGGLGAFSTFKSTSEGRWILRNFAYHDIISSVTLGRSPLLNGRYLEGITDVVDTYLGVASGVLVSISDISSLAIYPKTPDDAVEFYHRSLEIEESLQSWRCSIATSEPLSAVASAYQAAALVYLYRQKRQFARNIRGYFKLLPGSTFSMQDLDRKIHLEIQNILDHISRVPVDDISESCLLFPLFLAGGDASSAGQIHTVRQRLQSMLDKRQFRNIHRALEILETLWIMRTDSTKQKGDQCPDWTTLLKDQEEPLLLT